MLKIGYMDGTQSKVLTRLAAAGAETVPVGNGWDGHGPYIGHINKGDGFGALVGWFHKFLPLKNSTVTPADLLKPARVNNIPVFVIADKKDHAAAKNALGDVGANVKLVDPDDVADELLKLA